MGSITAVELGADICAFARTSVRRGEIRLTAAEILDPAAFPGIEAFTQAVRQTRRSLGLPRRCRAVVWGLPDGASRRDAAVKPLIEPLSAAGFRVDRVVSPCNALAALARRMKTSRGEGSTCWIAINRGGVAIVVVRPGKLLYSHSFAWDSSVGSSGSQARLLQRYSLVSFLSPELKRAMAESRKFGTPVDAVITCGNLPELRSLTMPLIEELDVEVETLDSLEGLVVKPQVADKLAEWAPAIRMACAAAIARGTRPLDPSKKTAPWNTAGTYARAAALAVAVAGVGYLWYMKPGTFMRAAARPAVSVPATAAKSNPPAVSVAATPPKSNPAQVTAPPASVSVKKPESNPKAASPPAAIPWRPAVAAAPPAAAKEPAKSNPPATNTIPRSRMQPLVTMPLPNTPAPKAPVPASTLASAPAPGVIASAPVPRVTPPAVSAPASAPKSNPPAVSAPAPAVRSTPPALNPPVLAADKPEAGGVVRALSQPAPAAPRGPMPARLRDAVPRVTAILVARDRRFATIDGGQIIGIGDLLGRRTVVGMDERSVVLQEPSGVQIRIGLGGRLLGIERAGR